MSVFFTPHLTLGSHIMLAYTLWKKVLRGVTILKTPLIIFSPLLCGFQFASYNMQRNKNQMGSSG